MPIRKKPRKIETYAPQKPVEMAGHFPGDAQLKKYYGRRTSMWRPVEKRDLDRTPELKQWVASIRKGRKVLGVHSQADNSIYFVGNIARATAQKGTPLQTGDLLIRVTNGKFFWASTRRTPPKKKRA